MKTLLLSMLFGVTLLASNISEAGCFLLLLDEPTAPKSLCK